MNVLADRLAKSPEDSSYINIQRLAALKIIVAWLTAVLRGWVRGRNRRQRVRFYGRPVI